MQLAQAHDAASPLNVAVGTESGAENEISLSLAASGNDGNSWDDSASRLIIGAGNTTAWRLSQAALPVPFPLEITWQSYGQRLS